MPSIAKLNSQTGRFNYEDKFVRISLTLQTLVVLMSSENLFLKNKVLFSFRSMYHCIYTEKTSYSIRFDLSFLS